jgi:transposase-like protein
MSGKHSKRKKPLTAEKKYQIFLEANRSDTKTGEILRREGIYASDLTRFRKIVKEGAIEKLKEAYRGRRGPTEEELEIAKLKAELREKNDALAKMTVERMILEKKVNGE